MPERIAITGSPGSGKSTVCKKVVAMLHCKAGGMISSDIRINSQRVGFEIQDIATGEKGILAHINGSGPKVGKYHVNLDDLDSIGVGAIEKAVEMDLIVIDEIAPMEFKSEKFINAVTQALDSQKPMLVVLHQKSHHPLAERIRKEFRVFTVDISSRDTIAQEIVKYFSRFGIHGHPRLLNTKIPESHVIRSLI